MRFLRYTAQGVKFDGVVAIGGGCIFDSRLRIRIGHGVHIGPYSVFQGNGEIRIDTGTYIGAYFSCNSMKSILIEKNCMIGNRVSIVDNNHGMKLDQLMNSQEIDAQAIIVKEGSWLGEGSIILPGVSIGDGAVIGAGAVVTGAISTNMIVVGIPARFKRFRD